MPPNPDRSGRIYVQPYGWVTPIRSRTGQILYYIDDRGSRVGNPMAGPGSGGVGAYQQNRDGSRTYDERTTAAKRRRAEQRAKDQNPETGVAVQAQQRDQLATLNQDVIWVDGKRVKYTGRDPETGEATYTLDGAGNPDDKGNPYVLSKPSAYGALQAGDLAAATTRFVMSTGTQTFADGTRNQTANPGWMSARAAEHAYTNTIGTNYMTIGNGLTWLANLSLKDPEAYQAMLDRLHRASYLTDGQYKSAGGAYNALAGNAFAKAAADLSVLNGEGSTLSLPEYLDKRAAANDGLANAMGGGAAYEPIQRNYTDPEYLKAAAKGAAEDVLGRQLSDDEEAKLTARFRGLEDQKYDQIDAAGRAGKAASVTDPQPAGQIDAFVTGPEHEQEAANYRAAEYGLALKRLFGLS